MAGQMSQLSSMATLLAEFDPILLQSLGRPLRP